MLVALQRLVAFMGTRSEKFEQLSQGDISTLVATVLRLEALENSALARERVFAQIRLQGLSSLGQVRRLYLEPSGQFTVGAVSDQANQENQKKVPGLSIVPAWDEEMVKAQQKAAGVKACAACGRVEAAAENVVTRAERCVCGAADWRPAVLA